MVALAPPPYRYATIEQWLADKQRRMSRVRVVTAAYTVIPSDEAVFAAGDVTVTLPEIRDTEGPLRYDPLLHASVGQRVWVGNHGTGTVTLEGSAGQLINAAATFDLDPDDVVGLIAFPKVGGVHHWRIGVG